MAHTWTAGSFVLALAFGAAGCASRGSGSYSYPAPTDYSSGQESLSESSGRVVVQAETVALRAPAASADSAALPIAPGSYDEVEPMLADSVADVAPAPPRELYAQARAQAPTEPTTGAAPPEPPIATDAVDTSGSLLIYTATFHLAVYEVRESQERIVAAAREIGGFVFAQSDDRVVVRVPAPRFHSMIERVEQAGDVEHRDVQAQDVSEEFHDVEIRIRNLEAMRARIEALLASAQNVEDALQVEQELQRITGELERMRGRQRFLADRIAFSTITILFRPRPRESLEQPEIFELPFRWLDELGLPNLLDLRR